MVGFDVRNMKEDDLEEIRKLSNNIDFLKFHSLFDKNKYKVIVAQLNDDIIGYINLGILNDIICKDTISINEILVDEMYRGLGVGYQLILEAEKIIKSYNVLSLVAINNGYLDEEIIFYNRQGFNLNSNKIYEKKYYS